MDIILAIRRPEGHQPGNRRVIESLCRYADVTPEKIHIELGEDGTYRLLGSDDAVAATAAVEFVSAAMGREFQQTDIGVTQKRLEELGADEQPPVKRYAIQAALARMIAASEVVRTGAGKAKDPYLYALAKPPKPDPVGSTDDGAAESAETQILIAADPADIPRPPVDLVPIALDIFADVMVDTPSDRWAS